MDCPPDAQGISSDSHARAHLSGVGVQIYAADRTDSDFCD
jgi:hypothetical protein